MQNRTAELGAIRYRVEWREEGEDFGNESERCLGTEREAIEFAASLVRDGQTNSGLALVVEQELGFDADILRHEHREIKSWNTLRSCYVEGPTVNDATEWTDREINRQPLA